MVSAANTNVTESKAATLPPPTTANRAAPNNGATRRPVSCRPSRHPLSRCRRSSGSNSANSAFSAGSLTASWMPYQIITAKMSQTWAADRTASRVRTTTADAAFRASSRRRRNTRSASRPAAGPSSDGA